MKDPLLEATQALREFGVWRPDGSEVTRARVITSLALRRGQQKRRWVMAMPLAALALGSVAMAATGGYLPAPVQKWVAEHVAFMPNPVAKQPRVAPHPAVPKPASVTAVTDMPNDSGRLGNTDAPATSLRVQLDDDAAQAPPTAADRSVAVNTARADPNGTAKSRPSVDDTPVSTAEFERYRVAHEAHFIRKDPAAALAAWSDYLAHSPTGRLAVEARYNRALCLLRLGRTSEARAALQPFTSGAYGAYRQKEARNLVATLDADAGR